MDRYFRLGRALCLAALPWLLPLPALAQRDFGKANSEWIILGRNEDALAYLDQRSVQRQGDLARVYQLTDFTTAQWVDERTVIGSVRALVEYDCAQPRTRTIAIEAYSEPMADGRQVAVEQNPEAKWEELVPGGSSEIAQRLVCRK